MNAITRLLCTVLPLCVLSAPVLAEDAPLRVPANTAYGEPNPDGLDFSRDGLVTGWKDARQRVVWYGWLAQPGDLALSIGAKLPAGQSSKLALAVSQVSGDYLGTLDLSLTGTGQLVDLPAGHVAVRAAGFHRFELSGVSAGEAGFGEVAALTLSGSAAAGAKFNLKPRRNCASVHIVYPTDKGEQIAWFYGEVTPRTEPSATYYEVLGWHRGYFGMQVNSPTERRIIFSVWDAGNEPTDPGKVAEDNRTKLLAKGDGVVANAFGNEGTGGHSHLVYPWVANQTYRFLLTAEPKDGATVYSGYFYFPERSAWGLIASFRAPKDGSYPRGLYGFNENFWGTNGHLRRLAEFGNQWIKLADGTWKELTTARFSTDGTGRGDRLDYGMGVVDGRFFLSNGGFWSNGSKAGDLFTRPALGKAPEITLPAP